MPVLTADQARAIATEWRARFTDEQSFDASWVRYFETATVPDVHRLEAWLAKDLAKDQVMHAGIVKEPTLPTRSRFQPNDCHGCAGNRYVRLRVPISDERFGKALPCPDCNGGRPSEVVSAAADEPGRQGAWCWHCGADEIEPARDGCSEPGWHGSPSTQGGHTLATVLKRF